MLTDSLPGWARDGGVEKMLDRLRDPETRKKIEQEMLQSMEEIQMGWDTLYVSSVSSEKWKDIEGLNIKEITCS